MRDILRSPKILMSINLSFGLFLWFTFSTDYSLAGTIPDILFPPVVGGIALISLRFIKRNDKLQQPLAATLVHLPSIIGGGLYVLIGIVMFIPPFTLGALFNASEIANETEIQRVASPDESRTAYVYFRGVGAYTGGNGRIYVRVRYNILPILERDIFFLSKSYAGRDSTNYLEWRDDDTIYISEIKQDISVKIIEAEIPQVITLPYYTLQIFSTMAEHARENQQHTVPVKKIPIYPGIITHDQSTYIENKSSVFRSFNVQEANISSVREWYEEALANPPWQIIRVEPNCIQAIRDINSEQNIYYWEFMGDEDLSSGVHVNVGTPNPITDTCKKYVETQ